MRSAVNSFNNQGKTPVAAGTQADSAEANASLASPIQHCATWKLSPAAAEPSPAIALALQALIAGDFQTRWETVKRLAGLGETVVPPLLLLVQDETAEIELRWFAIRSLGQFPTLQVIATLAQLVSHPDEDLSVLAAEQLAGLGANAVVELSRLLRSPQERLLAVRALAQIRQRSVIEPLLSVVTDGNAAVRRVAIEALGSFHDERATAALFAALSDLSGQVRQEAVMALGHRRDLVKEANKLDSSDALTQGLQACLWDVDLAVCRQAAIALGRLALPEAVPALRTVLQSLHTPEALLFEVVRALVWIDTADALSALIAAYPRLSAAVQLEILRKLGTMQASPDRTRRFLVGLLSGTIPPSLAAAADVLSNANKQAIALSLGQLGDRAAFVPLVSLLADPSEQVQFHCLRALDQLAAGTLTEQLEAVLNSEILPKTVQAEVLRHLAAW